jgi:molybdopterin-containing oxidoreductase family iron-sulfur binding subunit
MATKKYWKGLEELNNSPEFIENAKNEFAEQVPVDEFLKDDNLATNTGTNRRDFLKYLGFSVTAASLAACETPVQKAIPYVVKPDEITPGVANWYASTFYDGNDYASVIVKTREARPIKIEGNEFSEVTKGGTNARVQASVLSLYDSSRLTGPTLNEEKASWEDTDIAITNQLTKLAESGKAIRILSSSMISPSTQVVIDGFIAKYPTTKVVTYDPISFSGMLEANAETFGEALIPSYNFEKAEVIVSIAADFLANWLSPIEYANQYGKTRKVSKEKPEMSRHIQFESIMSLTGANADDRIAVKVSEQGKVAVNLYNAVSAQLGLGSLPATSLPNYDEEIIKTAKELVAAKGKSVVVAGSNDKSVQLVVNGINQMLGNYGTTIDITTPINTHQGNDADFAALVADMAAGNVGALITYNTNPVYTSPASLNFADAYAKVGLRISLADRADETASLAQFICPDSHYLESWNDYSPKVGHYSLSQPTITPLFAEPRHTGTRQAQDSFLKWTGNDADFLTIIQDTWKKDLNKGVASFKSFWNKSLHDGVVTTGVTAKSLTANISSGAIGTAAEKVKAVKTAGEGSFELALYEKVGIGNGNQANNPWLQELPDPISKITWDNYVTMSPLDMEGASYKLMLRQDREASIVTVSVNATEVTLPIVPQPGQAQGTIGIAVGYGREKAGDLSKKINTVVGKNAYSFTQIVDGTIMYAALGATVTDTGRSEKIAGTQVHHTMMGRALVKETVLDNYKKNPKAGNADEMLITHSGPVKANSVDLWPEFDRPGHFWGMTIDLNSCIGCGSCVVSCTAENNVAVVGKAEVMNTREMHWLRIDRYYTTEWPNRILDAHEEAKEKGVSANTMYLEMENPHKTDPKVVFQPVMCQHCNHAPCENVCPVLATNHSSDGLNMMTYNRCVGTRYCANNCPFKVRRFNWFNYNGNSDFSSNPTQDDLGRMVLNPDVVVRSRGVMEKCSMCVQRIQEGKLDAKKSGAPLVDGTIKTACQQSCPTNAISFGDVNDENSEIAKIRAAEADGRNYVMLDELGVKPSVSYLTKVRNCEGDPEPEVNTPVESHH